MSASNLSHRLSIALGIIGWLVLGLASAAVAYVALVVVGR